MTNYIIRRLLLMVPTILGITFLVFMLVALSPGGIGAGLRVSGGGQMDATGAALQQAYLNDRYGLDDPPVVQYGRWLSRISPLKFGQRDQVNLAGEVVTVPKRPKPPGLPARFASAEVPAPAEPVEQALPDGAEARSSVYRRAEERYSNARGRYITADALFKQAVGPYATEAGILRPLNARNELREEAFSGHTPDSSLASFPAIQQAADAVVNAYAEANTAYAEFRGVFDARPYDEAGVPVIPGGVWLGAPDFGRSFSRSRPVIDLVSEALPTTLLLNTIATLLIYAIAIPTGVVAAINRGRWQDVSLGNLFIALWSFPIPLAGILALGYLASDQYLGGFPVAGLSSTAAENMPFLPSTQDGEFVRGWLLDRLWHVVLPVMCLVYGGFAVLSKQTRAAMLDNFNADYVRTAKAKGVPALDVTTRHVFRNSLLPLITMFVTIFPAMLSGSVVIESIFTINGMGRLALEGINLRDRELILAVTFMIGVVNLVALLLADILYALADPRISYE